MREERWISTLKMILIVLAVIVIALAVTHTDEIGKWLAENLMHETNSNLRQILQ